MSNDNKNNLPLSVTPKLSICILTYNRAAYLDRLFAHLLDSLPLPFPFEIVISDNCSSDETPAVVMTWKEKIPQIRYLRQPSNVGSSLNLLAAYREARGEYCVYLADDDQLVLSIVSDIVQYMDEHPEVGVCHAPWEHWDDVTKQSGGPFYTIEQETVFEKKNAIELCNFILQRGIFPEISLYRTELARKIMFMPCRNYWAFFHLINALQYGSIAFLPTPFYRFVTRHWEGETRSQAGRDHSRGEWDQYRGGLEYMVHKAFTYLGVPGIPAEHQDVVHKMIHTFIMHRMIAGMRQNMASKDFISAFDIFIRLLANRALPENEIEDYRQIITGRAAVQALVETMDAVHGCKRIGLCDVDAPDIVLELITERRSDLTVKILTDTDLRAATPQVDMLVLTGHRETKRALVEAGYHPGHVIVELDLVQQFTNQ